MWNTELAIKILDKISLVAGIIAAFIMIWLVGIWDGYSYGGSHLCDVAYPIFDMNGGTYWASHADPYQTLIDLAGIVSISVLAFVLTKLFERGRFVKLVAAVPLFVAVYFGSTLWNAVSNEIVRPDNYLDMVRESSGAVDAGFALTIFILVIQIGSIVASFYKKNPDELQ